MTQYHRRLLLQEDPIQNNLIMDGIFDFIDKVTEVGESGGYLKTAIVEAFHNALHHSQEGVYPNAESLHKDGFEVTISLLVYKGELLFEITNISDRVRSNEFIKRAEIFRQNPKAKLGSARHIYGDDPAGRGRGNGLRDIFDGFDETHVTTIPYFGEYVKNTLVGKRKLG